MPGRRGAFRAEESGKGKRGQRTARMISLSSMVLSVSETASPIDAPDFLSASAAARNFGFSWIEVINYKMWSPSAQPSLPLPKKFNWREENSTRARSYACRACLSVSESWTLPTSPFSCATFCSSSRFFLISSARTSRKTWNGDFGASFARRCDVWKEFADDAPPAKACAGTSPEDCARACRR